MPWDTDTSVEAALCAIGNALVTPDDSANVAQGLLEIAKALNNVADALLDRRAQ